MGRILIRLTSARGSLSFKQILKMSGIYNVIYLNTSGYVTNMDAGVCTIAQEPLNVMGRFALPDCMEKLVEPTLSLFSLPTPRICRKQLKALAYTKLHARAHEY